MTSRLGADAFRAARDQLLAGTSWDNFRWPRFDSFNWALDHFDGVARSARGDAPALAISPDNGSVEVRSFAELSLASSELANWMAAEGVARGERALVMLENEVSLWVVLLALIKLGVVIVPCSTLLTVDDVRARVHRADASVVVSSSRFADRFDAVPPQVRRFATDSREGGWTSITDAQGAGDHFEPSADTSADDPMLLYFTSGTSALPKLVQHTHISYPVGHLTTMAWIGLQPGDRHLNLSSPGWAKHAWSSVFAPWNAEATVIALQHARFDARRTLDALVAEQVSTFCAPPTVWRSFVQQPMHEWHVVVRELVSAGEPLNPEVIDRVERAWGRTIRDGFGQTETTALVGNRPGAAVRPGSMGRPLPGYRVALLDAEGRPADEGELCVETSEHPVGLMTGYLDDGDATRSAFRGGYYHTGDVVRRDADGYLTYVGRSDDVFKSSDYRISPFELESVLIEHAAVAEVAVVPSPDARRLSVPKAFVVLAAGVTPGPDVVRSIFAHSRARLAPYKRIRRLAFAELPKTISGKIRRTELRAGESARGDAERLPGEHLESDFPDLLDAAHAASTIPADH